MGAAAGAHRTAHRGDRASRAPDPDLSQQRLRPGGSAGVGASKGSDSEVMKRRDFVETVGRLGGWTVAGHWLSHIPTFQPSNIPSLLIPMDDSQTDHLKAYGLTYKAIRA